MSNVTHVAPRAAPRYAPRLAAALCAGCLALGAVTVSAEHAGREAGAFDAGAAFDIARKAAPSVSLTWRLPLGARPDRRSQRASTLSLGVGIADPLRYAGESPRRAPGHLSVVRLKAAPQQARLQVEAPLLASVLRASTAAQEQSEGGTANANPKRARNTALIVAGVVVGAGLIAYLIADDFGDDLGDAIDNIN